MRQSYGLSIEEIKQSWTSLFTCISLARYHFDLKSTHLNNLKGIDSP
jgi:hypothetical protein